MQYMCPQCQSLVCVSKYIPRCCVLKVGTLQRHPKRQFRELFSEGRLSGTLLSVSLYFGLPPSFIYLSDPLPSPMPVHAPSLHCCHFCLVVIT